MGVKSRKNAVWCVSTKTGARDSPGLAKKFFFLIVGGTLACPEGNAWPAADQHCQCLLLENLG